MRRSLRWDGLPGSRWKLRLEAQKVMAQRRRGRSTAPLGHHLPPQRAHRAAGRRLVGICR